MRRVLDANVLAAAFVPWYDHSGPRIDDLFLRKTVCSQPFFPP